MAAVTHRVSTANTAVGPLTSGAFTPSARDLLIAFIVSSGTVEVTPVLSSSIAGQTFKLATSDLAAGPANYCFIANVLSTAVSQTVTITYPTDNSTGNIILVASVSGMSIVGLAAVRQSAIATFAAAGTPAATFGVACLTGNPTLGDIGCDTNPPAVTEPTSWTENADTGYNTPATGAEYVSRNSGFTGTTITWGSTVASGGTVLIVELDTSVPIIDSLGTAPNPHLTAVMRSNVR